MPPDLLKIKNAQKYSFKQKCGEWGHSVFYQFKMILYEYVSVSSGFFFTFIIYHAVILKYKLTTSTDFATQGKIGCAGYVVTQKDNVWNTVSKHQYDTPIREERRFLYFNHLSKEFLEQMIPHLKALI